MSRRKRASARAEPAQEKSYFAYWVRGQEDVIPGYTPLSKNESVLQCADKIADPVSSMTIMLMRNGENGDIREKNELSRKIDISPCAGIDRKNFVYAAVRDMVLYGNSVAIPQYRGEYLENIQLIDAKSCSFLPDERYGYVINVNGVKLRPDEVLHFVLNPSAEHPWKGEGYANIIRQTVNNLLQANATKNTFLKSKWQPSLIISVNADAEELVDPEMRHNILSSYRSDSERGEPWLIPAGEIKVDTIKPLTLNDLAIQDSISLDKSTLAAAMGIPPFMLGIGEFNVDAYNNFIATRIMSIAQIIQQQLTAKLLYSPELYFKFNPKSLMQYSLSEKMAFVKDMVSGGMMNRNEGRTEFDYAPVDKEGMNDYIVLENYVPVDRVGDQKKLNNKAEGGEE